MGPFIDEHRWFGKDRITRGNYNRICQILSVKHDPAARPTPDQIALVLIARDVRKSTKVSKRESRGLPAIKANGGNRGTAEQCFVNCHVHRRRTWNVIAINR